MRISIPVTAVALPPATAFAAAPVGVASCGVVEGARR